MTEMFLAKIRTKGSLYFGQRQALELGRGGSRGDLVEEIWQELAKARHTVWEQEALVRQRQQRELK